MSTAPTRPTKFCQSCGAIIDAMATQCPTCGNAQPLPVHYASQYGMTLAGTSEKRLLPAVLLCLMLGPFGAHRFYAGKIGTGILQLCTLGGLGIWMLIDFVMLVVGGFKDAEGNKITEWT
jgi:TM2 domain-containing membrane protein YozV